MSSDIKNGIKNDRPNARSTRTLTYTNPLLSVEDLHVSFRSDTHVNDVVEGVSFDIEAGETVGLVGESGSGKSVSALSILQLLPYPTAFHRRGNIVFDDENISMASQRHLQAVRGNDIAMIFQEPMSSLNPVHSIEKQISEVILLHRRMSRTATELETISLLTRVGINNPQARLKSLPHELSGGQRQRVMIAMALANQPKLLIADEPTTALDVTVQKQILDLLINLQAETGMAILLITHDLGVVRKMANRICVMKNGRIVEAGTKQQIFDQPQHDYTRKLLAAEPTGAPASPGNTPTLIEAKELKVWFPMRRGLLRRAYDHVKAVDTISFSIRRGETLGIVGESGSGKTTLGRAILGLQKAQGQALFEGIDIQSARQKVRRAMRRDIQIIFQDPYGALSPRLTVKDIIAEGLKLHEPHLTMAIRDRQIRTILQEVELEPDTINRYPHEFSGGQRQRIAIARALILQPKFLVLDEPTSALDRSVQNQIINLLRRLQAEKELTYLFISHDLKVVRALAHQVMVMQNGKCIEHGNCAQIFDNPRKEYTKTLIEAALDS